MSQVAFEMMHTQEDVTNFIYIYAGLFYRVNLAPQQRLPNDRADATLIQSLTTLNPPKEKPLRPTCGAATDLKASIADS